MDSRRRQKGYNRHQGEWRPAVPSWEKEFCRSVGSIPWKKLLEAKRYMCIYDKVLKWNDSAVQEAFHNAKERFWAKINGIPCNIALPDPNLYIDEVDWAAEVDPKLLSDLERGLEALDGGSHNGNYSGTIIFGDVLADQWANPHEDSNKKDSNKFKSNLDIVCDNWDTWDWGDPNRELEPTRPYVDKHKSSRFHRDDHRMGYKWNCRKELKQN
ncbi:hypothetical protein BT93_A2010 [Corymbia citriodora subsp. variegata]|nr:hypothetical protein BT93_A2010 [Corymbia citriodora subsp. variegata]